MKSSFVTNFLKESLSQQGLPANHLPMLWVRQKDCKNTPFYFLCAIPLNLLTQSKQQLHPFQENGQQFWFNQHALNTLAFSVTSRITPSVERCNVYDCEHFVSETLIVTFIERKIFFRNLGWTTIFYLGCLNSCLSAVDEADLGRCFFNDFLGVNTVILFTPEFIVCTKDCSSLK